MLDPLTLNWLSNQAVRGGLSVDVAVTSSNTTVGTITVSPVGFAAGASSANTAFNPATAGSSTIAIATPTGFSTPSNFQQITATVNP